MIPEVWPRLDIPDSVDMLVRERYREMRDEEMTGVGDSTLCDTRVWDDMCQCETRQTPCQIIHASTGETREEAGCCAHTKHEPRTINNSKMHSAQTHSLIGSVGRGFRV